MYHVRLTNCEEWYIIYNMMFGIDNILLIIDNNITLKLYRVA